MIVTLDPQEAMRAVMIGGGQRLRRIRDGSADRYGLQSDAETNWGRQIESVGAEMAFAKWLGVYYNPPLRPDDGTDVAGCQVRSSTFDGAHVLLHDQDTGPAVLVTGSMPEYVIRGWCIAEEVKLPAYLREGPRSCYWIPAAKLAPIEALRERLQVAA